MLDAGDIGIVLTLFVLETVLSFDNAAILTAISRRLPDPKQQKRVLTYGLLIAYGLRILAISLAVFLIRYEVFLTLGGLYLIGLATKHLVAYARHRASDQSHKPMSSPPPKPRFGLSSFSLTIFQIGAVDLVFALDQVVAAVGFTTKPLLIIIAATFGLLSLRLMAPLINKLMNWLPTLEQIAYVAVGFVGIVLVLEHPLIIDAHLHIAKPLKIAITLSLFAVPILYKLLFGRKRNLQPG